MRRTCVWLSPLLSRFARLTVLLLPFDASEVTRWLGEPRKRRGSLPRGSASLWLDDVLTLASFSSLLAASLLSRGHRRPKMLYSPPCPPIVSVPVLFDSTSRLLSALRLFAENSQSAASPSPCADSSARRQSSLVILGRRSLGREGRDLAADLLVRFAALVFFFAC
jgi:hypothetical protein